ncbi:MAG: PAS domain S-box protein [Candidatus Lokiarchaeota archaeon]|nr:PAS domain S-box protein [Candidatus Lokiarchaeota archaeon]MBD3199725.1 PAS domain S-box protein [Candidatus Lokiarchaeota archaeon]
MRNLNIEGNFEINSDLFKIIADEAQIGILIIKNNSIEYINKKAIDIVNIDVDKIEKWDSKKISKYIVPNYEELIKDMEYEEIEFKKKLNYSMHDKNGKNVWRKGFLKRIHYKNDIAYLLSLEDVTKSKTIELELRNSEVKFRTIAEQHFMGILIVQDFQIKYFNNRFLQMTGYEPSEIESWAAKEYFKLVHPDDRDSVISIIEARYRGKIEKIKNYEFRLQKKQGKILWVEIFSKAIPFSNGYADLTSLIDITDRKLAEQKIKDKSDKLESLLKAAPIGIGVVQDRFFKKVNDKFCELVGYSRKELIEQNARKIYPSDEEYNYVGREKYPQIEKYGIGTVETKFKKKDGKILDILLSSSLIDSKDPEKGATFTALDISERKKAENKLKKERDIFEGITKTSPVGIVMLNKEGEITFANPEAEKILGLRKNKITQRSYNEPNWKITSFNGGPFPDEQLPFSIVKNTLKSTFDVRHAIEWPNGKRVYLSINGAPIINNEGKFDGMVSIIDNITDRIKAETELKKSEEIFRNIFESIPRGMILYSLKSDGRLVFVNANPTADEFLGVDCSQFIGLTIEEAFPPLADTNVPSKYKELAKFGGTWNWEQIDYNYGQIVGAFEVTAFHIAPNTMVTSFQEISDRIKAENEITQSKEKYKEAYNRASLYKDIFTHDINNILQNIYSSSELFDIYQSELDYPVIYKELNQGIKEQVKRGSKLISNVRKLTEIEESKFELKPTRIKPLLSEAIKYIEKSVKIKNVNIDINFNNNFGTDNTKALVNDMLLDVFENIMFNAVRHNENDEIEIKVNVSKYQEGSREFLKFEFKDNGMGIRNSRKEAIFQRGNLETVSKGMGLGLSLVKKIIDRFNGKIWVEDRIKGDYSKGSNFIILIPQII